MELKCPICQTDINEEYNYCPMCGEPLSALAKQREDLKRSRAGLEQLEKLADSSTDPAVVRAIQKMLTKK